MTIRCLQKTALFPQVAILSVCATLLPIQAMAGYVQENLVSDISGLAKNFDTHLTNPWGISFSATGPFWVSNNRDGTSTLYNTSGTPQALVVTVPTKSGSGTGSPTGQVFNSNNGTGAFSGDRFIFATEDGTISGWSSGTNAVKRAEGSADSVYKGLAIDNTSNRLYAANFGNTGKIDAFNTNYTSTLAGQFVDPNLPANYAPFNIQNIGGVLYVAYAFKGNTSDTDETTGDGLGIVNKYDTNGNLINRLITGGQLNAPWGFALAPSDFGEYSNNLLVGNFGDGKINAYDPISGAYRGTLADPFGNPIQIDGLWGLAFGNGGNGGAKNKLYFAAGINNEVNGLFGSLAVVPEPDSLSLIGIGLLGLAVSRRLNKLHN
jgi:uncharacterized protein (TIGR03118 family)